MTPNGYPDDVEISKIENWSVRDPYGLMEYVRTLWNYPKYFRSQGRNFTIATGGWSGNETLIQALRRNFVFWGVCWESSHRGGLYKFRLPEAKP